jgi:hypothetical protein
MTDHTPDMRSLLTLVQTLTEGATMEAVTTVPAQSHMTDADSTDELFTALLSVARGQSPARTVMIYAPRGKAQEMRDALEQHFGANTTGRFATRLNFKPVFNPFRDGNTFFAGCYARAKDKNPESTPIFVSDDPRMDKFSNSRAQARILWIDGRAAFDPR